MKLEWIPSTVQPDNVQQFIDGLARNYAVKASQACYDNGFITGYWNFEGEPENLVLVVQDFMQLKPLA